jgi:hypothetical protein
MSAALEVTALKGATDWLEGYRDFWEGRHRGPDALLDELEETDLPDE